jgi:hypothetical protein
MSDDLLKFTLSVLLIGALYCVLIYTTTEAFEGGAASAPDQPATTCTLGFWCPVSSGGQKAYPCPGGTYGASTGLTDPTKCSWCQAGCVCNEGSITACPEPCPAGYYCVDGTGGSTIPILCPQGYYCPVSSIAPVICPAGVFCPPGTTSAG